MGYEIDDENIITFWDRLRFFICIKLAQSIFPYIIFHQDYWKKSYGITFTANRDFYKKLKYDLRDKDDDLEIEAKQQN